MACAVTFPALRPGFLASALLLHVLRLRYFPLGLAGFDQMMTVVLAGLLIAFVFRNSFAGELGLIFIAAQASLAYFASGAAKATSPEWRGGRAILAILNTRAYGTAQVSSALRNVPHMGLVLDWGTVLFEVLFPLAVFVGGPLLVAWLVAGVVFHVTIAATMGLHLFLWTFGATYPILLYVAGHLIGHPI